MKFGKIIPRVIHQVIGSDFQCDVTLTGWWPNWP